MTRLWQTTTIELSIKGDPLTQTQKGSKGDKIMRKIRTSKKGFTLAELLIVVAIIGVLVGISIPIFTAQLNKSKIATNQANIRAAKAAAVSDYLGEGKTTDVAYTYDCENGTITIGSADTTDADSDGVGETIGINIAYNSGDPTVTPVTTGLTLS